MNRGGENMATGRYKAGRKYKRIVCSNEDAAIFEMESGYFCLVCVKNKKYRHEETIPFVEFADHFLRFYPMEYGGDSGLTPKVKERILNSLYSAKAYPLASRLDLDKIVGLAMTKEEIDAYKAFAREQIAYMEKMKKEKTGNLP